MTDIITTAPITFRSLTASSLTFPKLGIGRALARIQGEFGHALDLAYVQRLHLPRDQSPVVLDGSEKGRDPSW